MRSGTDELRRRNRAASPLSGLLLLFPLTGFGQLIEILPAPPAHLPQLIYECETGAHYSACSVWVWHGMAYSAIWQNGAVGEVTVQNGNPAQIQFARRDSAGPVAGLTATYTAKWDGKSFSDGKITANLQGGTGQLLWSATPTVTPVLANPQQNYSYVNWYPAQLTAYAIFNSKGSFNMSVGTESNDYRLRGEQPMNPGDSRPFTQQYVVTPANYGQGVTYPQASVLAAIYADGTTFGNRGVLEALLEQRKVMIAALTSIGTTLCSMGEKSVSIADISSALNKQHEGENARSPAGNGERDRAYSFAQKSLGSRVSGRLAPDQAVRLTFNKLNQLRTGLAADPVRDAAGNLVIPAVSPLTCDLP
jgi:hypothetical protein